MAYVKPPPGRPDAENSKWLMENIVYLPIHSGMSDSDIRETVDRVIEAYNKVLAYLAQPGVPKPTKK